MTEVIITDEGVVIKADKIIIKNKEGPLNLDGDKGQPPCRINKGTFSAKHISVINSNP